MRVYLGGKSGNYFIMCRDFSEIFEFDSFGMQIGQQGAVSSCDNWQEVDFISVVSQTGDSCEILYDDYKSKISVNMIKVVERLRKYGHYLITLFTIPHKDEFGRFTQVIAIYQKGSINNKIVKSLFPEALWSKL